MPVTTQHSDYERMLPVWQTCRDVSAGQRAIHARGELYLPKLAAETDKDYDARKARALFFNATWRTVAGLSGMLMRRDPTRKVSTAAEPMLDDVTQSGLSLDDLARMATLEALEVGRFGLLVDYPINPHAAAADMTVADVEKLNLRPKIVPYKAEHIVNWRTEHVGNRCVVTRVVLQESRTVQNGSDEFMEWTIPIYRVLDLAQPLLADGTPDPSASRLYRMRVFRPSGSAAKNYQPGTGPGAWEQEAEYWPMMNGKRLDYLPFVFMGVDNTSPEVVEPPLIDLVYVNVSHYQSTADVEHGAHKTAMPQPWATGLSASRPDDPNPAKPTFYMGGGEIWMHPDLEGKFGMLEYTGQGLEAIEKRLDRKEKQMAVLGARMLEDQKKEAETAETAAMHRSGEQSALATMGKTISSGFQQALAWFDKWAGGSGGVEFALNSEFLPARLTAQEITALVGAWQAGGMSDQELFETFQKGGVVREDKEFDEHEAQIATSAPRVLAPPPTPGGGNDTQPGGAA